jgi:hypothetical protein
VIDQSDDREDARHRGSAGIVRARRRSDRMKLCGAGSRLANEAVK